MIKMLDTEASYYEPSKRSVNWLKASTGRLVLLLLFSKIIPSSRKTILPGSETHLTSWSSELIMARASEQTSMGLSCSRVTTRIQKNTRQYARSAPGLVTRLFRRITRRSNLWRWRNRGEISKSVVLSRMSGLSRRWFGRSSPQT